MPSYKLILGWILVVVVATVCQSFVIVRSNYAGQSGTSVLYYASSSSSSSSNSNQQQQQQQLRRSSSKLTRLTKVENQPPPQRRKNKKWDHMIHELQLYYQQHGHSIVSKDKDAQLYRWCQIIRDNYKATYCQQEISTDKVIVFTNKKKRILPPHKLKALQQVDFVWNLDHYYWDLNYQKLVEYYNKHGDCKVSQKGTLGIWVHNQRRIYQQYLLRENNNNNNNTTTYSSLTKYRLERLNQVGFEQELQSHEERWNQHYIQLQSYREQYGTTLVPQNATSAIDSTTLGQWVMNQRVLYRRGTLSQERISKLDSIHFCWDPQQVHWNTMFQRLEAFGLQHGHYNISSSSSQPQEDDNDDLRSWLYYQRYMYYLKHHPPDDNNENGYTYSLTDDREARLEALPNFSWKSRHKAAPGPSKEDWNKLFKGIRDKGIAPGMPSKRHWFDGIIRGGEEDNVKQVYTADELTDLWNEEDEEDDDDVKDVYGDDDLMGLWNQE